MNVETAIACIELAMRAAHNLNNVLPSEEGEGK